MRTVSTCDDGTRYVIHADAVILAAGGHTRIWRRTSSRRDENTGDSFRLAVEAGGRIRDPELVQFHPSGLIEPEDAAGTLVSEAARGEGGILRNDLGERFMTRYDPERMELSTRDRVALAAYTEIKEGRGTPRGGVWLDVSHLPRDTIMERLPRVYQTLLELQMLDITTTPIEIAPTAHYSMGGVWVRPEDHSTDVEGLYAIGEASSGLHGANRLGGNSLIELLVYGRIVGDGRRRVLGATRPPSSALRQRVAEARAEIDALLAADGAENVRFLQRARPQHDDRARRRRTRRERAAGRARRARRHRRTMARHRRAPRHRRIPGPGPRLRPQVVGWPRARPSRPPSNDGRPAAATTAPTTPTSTSRCRSTSSGPARADSTREPIPADPGRDRRPDARGVHRRQARRMTECAVILGQRCT